MVKLVFNPKDKNTDIVESKTSKKREINLNPFQFNESPEITSVKKEIVKDIVGLENCAYVLNDWYTKSITSDFNKLLLIIGPIGCGKTSLIELYCKENSINLYSVKSSSELIKTKKELLKDIISFSEYSSTSFFTKCECVDKKLILIDEYQNGQNDLLTLTDIQNLLLFRNKKLIQENKKELSSFLNGISDITPLTIPPILIISSDSKGTKLSDIKKNHEVYYINEIPLYTIKTWIKKEYTIEDKLLTEIIKKCKSDKRLLLNTLSFLKTNNVSNVNTFMDSFYKDTDTNIFEFINILFDNLEPTNIHDIFKVYDTDGFLLSNLVFENYLDFNTDIDSIAKSADSISLGETIFSDTYESTKSFIPEAHCINSLCIPSYFSRDDKPNKNLRTCCINNRYNIYLNNNKILHKINENNERNYSIHDIYIFKNIINHDLIKRKVLTPEQEDFLKNLLGSLQSIEKIELVYKHFSEFNDKETKTKNFTLKFKEKLKKIKEKNNVM
jgi:hypothetical protein